MTAEDFVNYLYIFFDANNERSSKLNNKEVVI